MIDVTATPGRRSHRTRRTRRALARPASPGSRRRIAQRIPARSRPHRPLHRVPPPRLQDPGVRQPRGRPVSHAAHALDRGRADRALGRARAAPERGPGRGHQPRARPRPHAVRPRRPGRAERLHARRTAASSTTCSACAWSTSSRSATRSFDGLNLTFETREGILKHCSLDATRASSATSAQRFLERRQPRLEAQLANLADEIAYNNHDVDDGLRSGLITLEQLEELPFFAEHMRWVERAPLRSQAAAARQRDRAANDRPSGLGLDRVERGGDSRGGAADIDAVRALAQPLIRFARRAARRAARAEKVPARRPLRPQPCSPMTEQAQETVRWLFEMLSADYALMPEEHARARARRGRARRRGRRRARRRRLHRGHDGPLRFADAQTRCASRRVSRGIPPAAQSLGLAAHHPREPRHDAGARLWALWLLLESRMCPPPSQPKIPHARTVDLRARRAGPRGREEARRHARRHASGSTRSGSSSRRRHTTSSC